MKDKFNLKLLEFLNSSITQYHAVLSIEKILLDASYKRIYIEDTWDLVDGSKYYVIKDDSSIIAFTYKKDSSYTIFGAHTDSPTLKVKPNPIKKTAGVTQFSVETYGGVLLNPWFDRDLSLAGKVSYLDKDGKIKSDIVDFKKAIAIIPSLAIHLDKKANKDRTINAQTDINPIIANEKDIDLNSLLLKKIDDADEILSYDLNFYDTSKASFVGLDDEFIASARLDNLLSCFVSVKSLIENQNSASMIVASNHEEVGSDSASGASGPFLENVLKKISSNSDQYIKLTTNSLLISCDNAHALHPNYQSVHEEQHSPLINQGVVIKTNSNQRYATNVSSVAYFKQAAKKADVKLQDFVTRGDMGCGSTIGPIMATRVGLNTIDVGLPTYAMHSIRELCGVDDAYDLYKILKEIKLNA